MSATMNLRQRVLYHQIHPLKLATDVGAAAIAAALFWRREPVTAFAVGLLPSVLVTAALLHWADLARLQASRAGRYIAGSMTRGVQLARFAALVPLWLGAWWHRPQLIAGSAAWLAGCWCWGLSYRAVWATWTGFVIAWLWTIAAGGGGLMLLFEQGPWPLTNGWFALLSGVSACPLTATLLRRSLGIEVTGRARIAVAFGIWLTGQVARGPDL